MSRKLLLSLLAVLAFAVGGGADSMRSVATNDTIKPFSCNVLNNSGYSAIPKGFRSRNLAHVILGREVAAPADVTDIITAVSETVKKGLTDNIYVAAGDADYFGLASISIAAGSDAGGAFSAVLADIPGRGRNLDFVVVAKNPYKGKNGNTHDHVIFQSRNLLSNKLTADDKGGHYMNPTGTNAGGYFNSKGRKFVITQVMTAIVATGVPLGDISKCPPVSRRVANGGPAATATDTINDVLFLLTEYEVFGTHTCSVATFEPASTQTHFSDYYADAASKTKYYADASMGSWWAASPMVSNSGAFCLVGNSASYRYATAEHAITPAFAVG